MGLRRDGVGRGIKRIWTVRLYRSVDLRWGIVTTLCKLLDKSKIHLRLI